MQVESTLSTRAFKGTPLALIIVASLTFNGLLIKFICGDIRMRTTTNMFLLSQSIADIATAILVMIPSFVAVVGDKWLLGNTLCHVHGFFNLYFTIITVLNLAMVALDRYFAIARASLKAYALPKRTALYITFAIWSVAIVGAFPWAVCFSNSNNVKITFFRGFYACGTTYKQPMSAYSLTEFILGKTIFAFAPFVAVVFCFYRIMKTVSKRRHQICSSITSNQMRVAIDIYARSAYISLLLIVTSLVFVFPACFTMTIDGLQITHVDPDFETALKWLMWLHCLVKPVIYATKRSLVRRKYKISLTSLLLTKSILSKTSIINFFFKHSKHSNNTQSNPAIYTVSNLSNMSDIGKKIPLHSKEQFDAQLTDKMRTIHVAIKKAWSLDNFGFSDINLDVECSASNNGKNV